LNTAIISVNTNKAIFAGFVKLLNTWPERLFIPADNPFMLFPVHPS
jgi:hypothetical protein